jgi:hypothetical protein
MVPEHPPCDHVEFTSNHLYFASGQLNSSHHNSTPDRRPVIVAGLIVPGRGGSNVCLDAELSDTSADAKGSTGDPDQARRFRPC